MALRLLPALAPRVGLNAVVASSLARTSFRGPRPWSCAAPAHVMSTSATPRQPLRYEIWDYFKAFMWRTRVYTAVSTLAGVGVVGYMWLSHRAAAVSDNVLQTFESGGKPGWDAEFDKDASASIDRPDVEKKLEELFFGTTDLSASYVLIMGEHGTGKSTAVRRVVRNKRGINGAIYVNAPRDLTTFGSRLASSVGFTSETVDTQGGVRRRFNLTTKQEAVPKRADEPMSTWSAVSDSIEEAATMFRKKHGRPAVLIIDSAERIAKKNPALLADLQEFAKDETDGGTLRMVFVSSDGSVLAQLDSRSESSRGLDPIEVGDICDADAVKFLVERGINKEQAEVAVRDITGGRFALLQRYLGSWKANTNEATRADLFRKTRKSLRLAGIDPRHEFFRTLLAKKQLDDDPARDMWGDKHETILNALLTDNIVAAHPNLTYTFHSRHVETYFKAVFGTDGNEAAGKDKVKEAEEKK
jgi:hypothetical protein